MDKIKNIQVLFLASWYPSKDKPFNGIFIFKHARCVAKQGLNVIVLSTEEHNKNLVEIIEDEREGVRQFKVMYPKENGLLRFRARYRAFMFGFNEINKNVKIDIVHANVTLPAGIVARNIRRKFKIPYVITEHSTIFLPSSKFKISFYKMPFVKSALRHSSAIFPVSKDLKNHMKLFAPNAQFQIIPNVVDTNLFKLKNYDPNSIRFLHISNLAPQKNIVGILEVYKKIESRYNNVKLTIVSESDVEKASKYITQNSINSVKLISGLAESGVAKLMGEHDVFILFSDTENLPCVLLEAQACGLVIISSDVGGVAEIVDSHALGRLVKAQDKEGLFSAIDNVIKNLSRYKKERIRERSLRLYSDNAVASNFVTYYKNILKGVANG